MQFNFIMANSVITRYCLSRPGQNEIIYWASGKLFTPLLIQWSHTIALLFLVQNVLHCHENRLRDNVSAIICHFLAGVKPERPVCSSHIPQKYILCWQYIQLHNRSISERLNLYSKYVTAHLKPHHITLRGKNASPPLPFTAFYPAFHILFLICTICLYNSNQIYWQFTAAIKSPICSKQLGTSFFFSLLWGTDGKKKNEA